MTDLIMEKINFLRGALVKMLFKNKIKEIKNEFSSKMEELRKKLDNGFAEQSRR